jgi:hypothetical protein
MAAYWFYHEYLDELRRFRIHRIDNNNETEARKQHRQACNFHWVTQHIEPSVSALLSTNGPTQRTLIPSHRPGDTYSTEYRPVPCPPSILQQIRQLKQNGAEPWGP